MHEHAPRGPVGEDVPAYLLTHFRRDMPSLMALLDALDRFSLEQKRAITLPLLRTMLAQPPSGAPKEVPLGGAPKEVLLGDTQNEISETTLNQKRFHMIDERLLALFGIIGVPKND